MRRATALRGPDAELRSAHHAAYVRCAVCRAQSSRCLVRGRAGRAKVLCAIVSGNPRARAILGRCGQGASAFAAPRGLCGRGRGGPVPARAEPFGLVCTVRPRAPAAPGFLAVADARCGRPCKRLFSFHELLTHKFIYRSAALRAYRRHRLLGEAQDGQLLDLLALCFMVRARGSCLARVPTPTEASGIWARARYCELPHKVDGSCSQG